MLRLGRRWLGGRAAAGLQRLCSSGAAEWSALDEEIAMTARRLSQLRMERAARMSAAAANAEGTESAGERNSEGAGIDFMGLAKELGMGDNRPLDGVRVLDLSRILAGPFCTMIMGDLGAEVIKVERKNGGDDTRGWGPPFVNGESSYFLCVNRNKKSMTIDLRSPKARHVLYRLVKECDVVVENFIPGAAEKLSIDYHALKQHNESLVYASISGYGSTGPYKNRPGYDVNIAAIGGMMSITGERGGAPVKVGVALTDIITGLLAQGCISSALVERARTGKGRHLELALLDSQVASLANVASSFLNGGWIGQRWGTAHASIVPYQGFEASDGYVVVSANNDEQWLRLCSALDRPDLGKDERYLTNAGRVASRETLVEELSETFRTRDRTYWINVLSEHRLSACPINDVKEVFEDVQVSARGMKQKIHHPVAGDIYLPGIPFMMDGQRPEPRLPPPVLGQHTDEVLVDILGMSTDEVASLRADGAV